MEDGQYAAISGYLEHGTLHLQNPINLYCKEAARITSYKLYYKEQIQDRSYHDRLVKRSETDRAFLECHLTAGGQRGWDATVGKVKERYYWSNFYKKSRRSYT